MLFDSNTTNIFNELFMKNSKNPPQSIQEFQNYLEDLYGNVNKGRLSDYLYGYLSRSVSYLGKNLAQSKVEEQHFMRSLSWLFAIASHYGIKIENCLFSRFPSICPYCLTSPCICFKTKKQPVSYIPAYKASRERIERYQVFRNTNRDWSMSSAVNNLAKIYPNNEVIWHHAGPWYLVAKMHEEVGELHEAMSRFEAEEKPISVIEEELSDTLAWILSAWSIVFGNRSLDDSIINYYYQDCPVCTTLPCECSDRSNRSAELIDSVTLLQIKSKLEELQQILPSATDSILKLVKSVEAAKEDQSQPTAVHALQQTKVGLSKIREGINATDDISSKGLSIINSITKLIEMLPL